MCVTVHMLHPQARLAHIPWVASPGQTQRQRSAARRAREMSRRRILSMRPSGGFSGPLCRSHVIGWSLYTGGLHGPKRCHSSTKEGPHRNRPIAKNFE